GIDIWMTTTAVANGFKTCQSFLGAKIHQPKDPGADLSDMLVQVVGSVFHLMETHRDVWAKVSSSEPVKEFGFRFEVGSEPIHVNLERMIDNFKHGVANLYPIWQKILSNDIMVQLREIASHHVMEFRLPTELWVKIIYDFALAYHHRTMSRIHILKSLTPLYLGRCASFVNETVDSTPEEVDEEIEALCQKFENQKIYLLTNWDKGKRR
ncbi:MAG: glycosyl transferase family 2, partial [candidate division Zixibacteria bacterium]|nr:glycosyl transferase family 2 [candidate division Zixibacteria bacterium]